MQSGLIVIKINVSKLKNFDPTQLDGGFIQDGIAHAISCQSKESFQQKGMNGSCILGFVKDPKKPATPENFKGNSAFKKMVFYFASQNKNPKFLAFLKENEGKNTVLVDQRSAGKVDLKSTAAKQEVIGVYKLNEKGEIQFQANKGYSLVSQYGLAQATPQIRKAIFEYSNAGLSKGEPTPPSHQQQKGVI